MWPAGDAGCIARRLTLGDLSVRVVERGPPTGPPVLLVHGWGASAYSFRHTMDALAASGYRAVVSDLPGHGLSDKPGEPDAYRESALLSHLESLCDVLGLRTFHLVGQSMGGRLALRFARDRPERVRSVVAINPIGTGPVRGLRAGRWLSRSLLSPTRRRVPVPRALVRMILSFIYGTLGDYTEQDVDEYWAPSREPSYAAALAHLLLEYTWVPARSGEWTTIRPPALLLLGTRDRLVRADREGLSSLLPPGARIEIIAGGGHILQAEAPLVVNEAILQFLAAVDTREASG